VAASPPAPRTRPLSMPPRNAPPYHSTCMTSLSLACCRQRSDHRWRTRAPTTTESAGSRPRTARCSQAPAPAAASSDGGPMPGATRSTPSDRHLDLYEHRRIVRDAVEGLHRVVVFLLAQNRLAAQPVRHQAHGATAGERVEHRVARACRGLD